MEHEVHSMMQILLQIVSIIYIIMQKWVNKMYSQQRNDAGQLNFKFPPIIAFIYYSIYHSVRHNNVNRQTNKQTNEWTNNQEKSIITRWCSKCHSVLWPSQFYWNRTFSSTSLVIFNWIHCHWVQLNCKALLSLCYNKWQ